MDDQPVLRKKVTIVDTDRHGRTQLHRLASRDCHTSVARLLNQGFSANITDHKGRTALHYAAQFGHTDTVRVLVKGNASVNCTDKFGRTALFSASGKGHNDVVKLLLESRSKLDLADKKGFTALHNSAYNGHREVVNTLLAANPPLEAADILGGTALHASAYKGFSEITQRLIQAGASINAQDTHKQTALHKAVIRASFQTVQVLVNFKACLDVQDVFADTPLQSAVRYGHQCIAIYLQLMSWTPVSVDTSSRCKDKTDGRCPHGAGTKVRAKSASYAETKVPPVSPYQTTIVQLAACQTSSENATDIKPTVRDTPTAAKLNTLDIPFQNSVIQFIKSACSSPELPTSGGLAGSDRGQVNVIINFNFKGKNCNFGTNNFQIDNVDNMINGQGSINVYDSRKDSEKHGSCSSGDSDSGSHTDDISQDGSGFSHHDSIGYSTIPGDRPKLSNTQKNDQSFGRYSQKLGNNQNSMIHSQISGNHLHSTGDSQLPPEQSSDTTGCCQKFSVNNTNCTYHSQISGKHLNSTDHPKTSGNNQNSTHHSQISEHNQNFPGHHQIPGNHQNSTDHAQLLGNHQHMIEHPQTSRNHPNPTDSPQISGSHQKSRTHAPNSTDHSQTSENNQNSTGHPHIFETPLDITSTSHLPQRNKTESNSYFQKPVNQQDPSSLSPVPENDNCNINTSVSHSNIINRNKIHGYISNCNHRAENWTGRGEMLVSYL